MKRIRNWLLEKLTDRQSDAFMFYLKDETTLIHNGGNFDLASLMQMFNFIISDEAEKKKDELTAQYELNMEDIEQMIKKELSK